MLTYTFIFILSFPYLCYVTHDKALNDFVLNTFQCEKVHNSIPKRESTRFCTCSDEKVPFINQKAKIQKEI